MRRRRAWEGDEVRRAILAVAIPGKLLPPQSEIGRLIGMKQPNVHVQIERLRDEWKLVTQRVLVQQPKPGAKNRRAWPRYRLLVVAVNP